MVVPLLYVSVMMPRQSRHVGYCCSDWHIMFVVTLMKAYRCYAAAGAGAGSRRLSGHLSTGHYLEY